MDLRNLTETDELQIETNSSESESHMAEKVMNFDAMEIVQLSIAPVGIIGNLTVIVVFLNHQKLRRKIPNRLIVNQVRHLILLYNEHLKLRNPKSEIQLITFFKFFL